jgi:VCBS repeat-containing protein
MPTLHKTAFGRVTNIWGSAMIRGADGRMHVLKTGDVVHEGDVILTSQNGIVQLDDERGAARLATLLPPDEANRVIDALNSDDPDAATAAGLSGGDGSLQPGLRVERISESLSAAGFLSEAAPAAARLAASHAAPGSAGAVPSTPAETPNQPPQATPGAFSGDEDTRIPIRLAGSDADGTVVGVTVTAVPAGATLLLGDGTTVVAVGQTLTPAQAAGLLLQPPHDFHGSLEVQFTVTDDDGAVSAPATAQIGVIPVNDAPLAHPDLATTPAGTPVTVQVLGNDSDPDGDALHVQAATVDPALGTVVVNVDGSLSYTPAAGVSGPVVISYTVADPSGASSSSTATVTVLEPPPAANHAPLADSTHITATEDGAAVSLGLAAPTDADGDALAIVVSVLPVTGQVQLADGTPVFCGQTLDAAQLAGLKYLPPADYVAGEPVGSFVYSVSDGHAVTSGSTSIAVTPVDDAPQISSDSGSIVEDQPPISGVLTATDADNPALAFVPAMSGGAWGSLTLDAAGHWTYALAPAAQALAEGQVVVELFTVGLNDGSTTTVTITVTGTGDAPLVSGQQSGSVTEDATLVASGTIVVADADAGQSGTQPASLAGAYGDLVVDAAGHWSYTLRNGDANVQALHQGEQVQEHFSVLSADGTPIAIDIVVHGANELPTALANDATGSEGTPVAVTLQGSDVDGSIATFTLTALPEHGTLYYNGSALAVGSVVPASGNAAALVFVPDAHWNGSTSLAFSATDNDGGSSAAVTQAILVGPVNDPPLALDDSAATGENTPVTIAVLANDSDPDGDALVVTGAHILSGAGSVTVNPDGSLAYDPGSAYDALAPGATATVRIAYDIADGHGGTASAIATVTVTGSNDGPIARPDTNAVSEDGPAAGGNVLLDAPGQDSDVDGGTLVVTGVAAGAGTPAGNVGSAVAGAWGSLVLGADGHYTYTPGAAAQALVAGQSVTDTFSYSIADGQGGSASTTLTITVHGADDAPSFGGSLTGDVTEDGVLVATGAITVDDADAGQSSIQPRAATGTYGSFSIDAGGHWTYTLNNPAANVQSLAEGQTVTESFVVHSADGTPRTVVVAVHGTDDAPVALADAATTPEDVPLAGNVLANDSDIDGGALSVTQFEVGGTTYAAGATALLAGIGQLRIDGDGSYQFAPAANYNGPVPVATYTVSDGILVSTSTLTLNVTPVNDPPLALDDAFTIAEDATLVIDPAKLLGNDSDPDHDALAIASVQDAVNGSVALVGGQVVFTPGANYNGSASFSYTISDGHGGSSTATVHVEVLPVNDPPLAADDSVSTPEDQPLTLAPSVLLANDSDPEHDALTLVSVQGALHGTVALVGGSVVFTPDADYNGPASFTYTVADSHGATSTATVNVAVLPVNDAPAGIADVASTPEDTPLAGNVHANDSDIDGPALAVTHFSIGGTGYAAGATAAIAGIGTLVIGANGDYLFTPAANYNGPVPLATYTLSDGEYAASATLAITVTPVNDVPATAADVCGTDEGTNGWLPGNVLLNDSDAEGDPLHVSYVATSAGAPAVAVNGINTITTALGGLVIMNADGGYRYIAPARNHADATPDVDSFVYRASDGHGDSAWTTVQINIVDTNPSAVADAAAVAFNGTVAGNLLFNDLSVDMPRSVTSVSFGGTSYAVAPGGTTTIDTPDGLLTVASDGSYSYTSQIGQTAVLTGGSLEQWEQVTDLYGFHSGTAWQGANGGLNVGALDATSASAAVWVQSNTKAGVGVAGGGSTVGSGESLIVHLHETTHHATIGIGQLNANQDQANAHWYAYDGQGALVASGSFAGASLNNGGEYSMTIDTAANFDYLRFSWDSNSQGFVLSTLEIQRQPESHVESFGYTMSDGDGDLASATLTVTPGTASSTQTADLDGTAGGDYLVGDARDNVIAGLDNNDQLYGQAGQDTLLGGKGHDLLNGGAGNDTLDGGSGNDILYGGAGHDLLTGGDGADVFAWNFADRGSAGAPAIDRVADFNLAAPTAGGDVLDLRDLLQNEQNAASLDRYLELDTTSQPGNTLIHVSSGGNFSGNGTWSAAQAGAEDQTIVLQGITDLRSALSLDAAASDHQVIQELVNRSKLLVDHNG